MTMQEVSTNGVRNGVASHRTPSGRTIVLETGEDDQLKVVGRDGLVELSVRFTDAGPVITMAAARVEVGRAAEVAIDCDDFSVRARRSVKLSAGEELVQEAAGEVRVESKSDIWLNGSMVLLNCDRERELRERAARQEAIASGDQG